MVKDLLRMKQPDISESPGKILARQFEGQQENSRKEA
jgi:hypothetical protein